MPPPRTCERMWGPTSSRSRIFRSRAWCTRRNLWSRRLVRMIERDIASIDQGHGDEHQITKTRDRTLADPRGLLDSVTSPRPRVFPQVPAAQVQGRIGREPAAGSTFSTALPVFVPSERDPPIRAGGVAVAT